MLMADPRKLHPPPSVRKHYQKVVAGEAKHICPSIANKAKEELETYYPETQFEVREEEAFGQYSPVYKLSIKSTL